MEKWLVFILLGLAIVAAGVIRARPYFKAYGSRVLSVAVQWPLRQYDRNIRYQMDRIACEQTARFVMETMPKVRAYANRFALFDRSLKAVDMSREGLFCEFGVYTGSAINYVASKTDRTIHGFDSFEGLPEDWRTGAAKGTFEVSRLPKVRDNVRLYKGWFHETLPVWAKEHPGPILFMHLDADLYSSTKTVFEVLGDRVVPGTVMQFDEFFNYPGWQQGEYKAFQDFVDSRQITFEYLGYCGRDEQVSVCDIFNVGAKKGAAI